METIGIEAGNSRVKLGLFRNAKLVEVQVIETENIGSLDVPAGWKKIKPGRIGLSSVVPSINPAIKKKFSVLYGKRVVIIKSSDCGIPLKIKNPGTVGIDRVLNCKAALELFGSPVVVVDVGTAITVDAATEKDGFAGGSIIPGAELWMKALMTTSLIKNSRTVNAGFPGKNTDEAISTGIKYGIPGAINGLLAASLKKYPFARIVLAGGGFTLNIRKNIIFKCISRKYLTLEGIGLVLNESGLWK